MTLPDHDQKRPNLLNQARTSYVLTKQKLSAIPGMSPELAESIAIGEATRTLTPPNLRKKVQISAEVAQAVVKSLEPAS